MEAIKLFDFFKNYLYFENFKIICIFTFLKLYVFLNSLNYVYFF